MALEAVLGHKTPCTTSLCFSAWHARILIRLMSPRIEISVHRHQWFQAHPGNQGAMHTSQSELCLTLVWMLAKNVTVATVLKICSFTGLFTFVLRLIGPWSLCWHGSLQTICMLLTCKQRVGNTISIKTLVRRLPGLPDLFRRPCDRSYFAPTSIYRVTNQLSDTPHYQMTASMRVTMALVFDPVGRLMQLLHAPQIWAL